MAKTILLADDSVTIQKVVELTFMDEDYQVVATSDGQEALDKLAETSPDLVIADVHMPGADGYEVCRRVKAMQPGMPVLLLVGTFEQFDDQQAQASGADGHLKKPFDSQDLLTTVKELTSATAAPATAATSEVPLADIPSFAKPEPVVDDPFGAASIEPTADLEPPALLDEEEAPAEASPSAPSFEAPPFDVLETAPEVAAEEVTTPVATVSEDAPFEAPAVEATPFEAPSLEAPSLEAPAVEASPFEVPGLAAPAVETSAVEAPAIEASPFEVPSFEEPAVETPAVETPAAETPSVDSPAEEPPVSEASEEATSEAAAVEEETTAAAPEAAESNGHIHLSDGDVDRIAKRVVELIGDKTLRDISWEVIPDLAEVIIKERIRELESQVE